MSSPKFRSFIIIFVFFTSAYKKLLFGDIPLEGKWLFRLGDDLSWADPAQPESLWLPIKVPGYWEDQNYEDYDGYAWYRKSFVIDSTLLKQDTLVLELGKISDCDETYLNGLRIGRTGSFPPQFQSAQKSERIYFIPRKFLLKENVLTIRVYNHKGNGGLYSGPVKISIKRPPSPPPPPITTPPTRQFPRSISQLPSTNGIAAICYNINTRSFTHFYPHIYRKYNPNTETPNLIKQAYPIIQYSGKDLPIKTFKTLEVGYIEGTGIIKHVLKGSNFTLTQYAFAPFKENIPVWIYYLIVEGEGKDSISINFLVDTDNPNVAVGKWSFYDNQRKWLCSCILYNTGSEYESKFLLSFKQNYPGFKALIQELDWWDAWHRLTLIPSGLDSIEKSNYLQSLTILKMAQCREGFPAGGQIIASLPPNIQNYCWVRDQAQAIEAFLLSGHVEEAKSALQFILNGQAGKYKFYRWNQQNIGLECDYGVSIFSYYGNGTEYTIFDDYGMTQNLDGLGLTMWNLRRYAETSEDWNFIAYYWNKISKQIADVLVALVDETGLIRIEPGPWEKALPFKHYLYTSAWAYRGLVDAIYLARMMNDEKKAELYEAKAYELRNAIEKYLVDNESKCLKKTKEDSDINFYLDASTAEVLPFLYNPQEEIYFATVNLISKYLTHPNGGVRRNMTDLRTTNYEWVYGDFIFFKSLIKMKKDAQTLAYLKDLSTLFNKNFGFIPQYINPQSREYYGISQRNGLGAGKYIQLLWQ